MLSVRRLALLMLGCAAIAALLAYDDADDVLADTPSGPFCHEEGLAPGTPCILSWRHVKQKHTDSYYRPIAFHNNCIHFRDVVTMIFHYDPHPNHLAGAWREADSVPPVCTPAPGIYIHQTEGPAHDATWDVIPPVPCTNHELVALQGRPSGSSRSLSPTFSPGRVGYYLALESSDTSGWLSATPQGCASLDWLEPHDGTFGSWRIFNVAHGSTRDVYLHTYGDTESSVYAVRIARADCDAGIEHRHGTLGCHEHPQPVCTPTGQYETIQGTGHGVGTTAICGISTCVADEHDHGLRACHPHPAASCGIYTTIVGSGHGSATGPPCTPTPTVCTNHQHVATPGSPGSPGVDADGDGDYNDPGDTPPTAAIPPTYYTHAHCKPLCTWPVGAHYLIHTGGGNHGDAYELCLAASAPSVACTADGVASHGDAVRVTWTDGPTASFSVQYQYTRGGSAFGSLRTASSSSSTAQLSFDTASLDASFGALSRGVRVRVSALRYSWSSWRTISCGISCTAALDNLASRVHVVAGAANAATPLAGVGLTQVIEPAQQNTMYLIDTSTGARILDQPAVNECGNHEIAEWDWTFTPPAFSTWTTFAPGGSDCTAGGSYCVYEIVDDDAIGNTFRIAVRPVARTKLTGRIVYGATSATEVLTRSIWAP